MYTTNYPIVPPPIPINHAPPISSLYRPPIPSFECQTQPYIFLNPLDHAHVGPFPLSTLSTPIIAHDQTP
jgi:hypothetical protein